MGPDWQPLGKPRHGHEVEFDALYEELVRSKDVDSSIWDRFAKIEISPYETLGAPRVGTDAEAGRWALLEYRNRPWRKLFVSRRKWMKVFNGYYVLDLVPRNDGIPAYSNGGRGSYCEVFSFRGKFLELCNDLLSEELLGEAWTHHTAAELMDYGARLHDRAVAYAEMHRVTEVLASRDPPREELEEPSSQAHIVISAARWCQFWGGRGHGMVADF